MVRALDKHHRFRLQSVENGHDLNVTVGDCYLTLQDPVTHDATCFRPSDAHAIIALALANPNERIGETIARLTNE